MFHHHGSFYAFFLPPHPRHGDHAVTSPKSFLGASIQAYFKIHSDNFHATFETALAKCLGALRCLGACCRAYQPDALPLAISPEQPMLAEVAALPYLLSVTACLFIQLELFESLELPDMCQCLQGETSVYNIYFLPDF